MTKFSDIVLQQVNEIRKEVGLGLLTDLPKGYPGDPLTCPIANCFNGKDFEGMMSSFVLEVNNYNGQTLYYEEPPRQEFSVFMHLFDAGLLPQYIADDVKHNFNPTVIHTNTHPGPARKIRIEPIRETEPAPDPQRETQPEEAPSVPEREPEKVPA